MLKASPHGDPHHRKPLRCGCTCYISALHSAQTPPESGPVTASFSCQPIGNRGEGSLLEKLKLLPFITWTPVSLWLQQPVFKQKKALTSPTHTLRTDEESIGMDPKFGMDSLPVQDLNPTVFFPLIINPSKQLHEFFCYISRETQGTSCTERR